MVQKQIIFHHLPKTGGTTIGHYLAQLHRPAVFRMTWDKTQEHLAELAAMTQAQRQAIRFISGHTSYHLFSVFPAAFKFTVLREPVMRVVSWYSHIRRFQSDPWYEHCHKYSLAECIARGEPGFFINDYQRLTLEDYDYVGTDVLATLRTIGWKQEVEIMNRSESYPVNKKDLFAVEAANKSDIELFRELRSPRVGRAG